MKQRWKLKNKVNQIIHTSKIDWQASWKKACNFLDRWKSFVRLPHVFDARPHLSHYFPNYHFLLPINMTLRLDFWEAGATLWYHYSLAMWCMKLSNASYHGYVLGVLFHSEYCLHLQMYENITYTIHVNMWLSHHLLEERGMNLISQSFAKDLLPLFARWDVASLGLFLKKILQILWWMQLCS